MPVPRRTAPAHRQHAVDNSKHLALRAIAQRRKIRNQADEPKHCRDSRVSRDREYVPHQRAAKLWPDAHRVRIRKQPVSEPRPSQVHHWKNSRLRNCKQSHGFRKAIDRSSPLLSEQQEDCRDQSSRVANPNPPNKVNDCESPTDRLIDAPQTDAIEKQIRDCQ